MLQNNFTTFDIFLTSALITAGYELLDMNLKPEHTKAQFVIRTDEGLENSIEEFWNGTLTLNARRLFENLRMLKNRLYAMKNV